MPALIGHTHISEACPVIQLCEVVVVLVGVNVDTDFTLSWVTTLSFTNIDAGKSLDVWMMLQ
jgi:hypothetical protein